MSKIQCQQYRVFEIIALFPLAQIFQYQMYTISQGSVQFVNIENQFDCACQIKIGTFISG